MSIRQTRRGFYLADGKQDIAEEKRGAHLQHMTLVRDMFQRYVKMMVMKETGGDRKEKKKKKVCFGSCPGGKVHFCHQT